MKIKKSFKLLLTFIFSLFINFMILNAETLTCKYSFIIPNTNQTENMLFLVDIDKGLTSPIYVGSKDSDVSFKTNGALSNKTVNEQSFKVSSADILTKGVFTKNSANKFYCPTNNLMSVFDFNRTYVLSLSSDNNLGTWKSPLSYVSGNTESTNPKKVTCGNTNGYVLPASGLNFQEALESNSRVFKIQYYILDNKKYADISWGLAQSRSFTVPITRELNSESGNFINVNFTDIGSTLKIETFSDCATLTTPELCLDNTDNSYVIAKDCSNTTTSTYDDTTTPTKTTEEYENYVSEFIVDETVKSCAETLGNNLVKLIQIIYLIVKIGIPVLVVVLSMMDFLKVSTSSDPDKEMKVAFSKLIKRIIIIILVFILPLLFSFLQLIWPNLDLSCMPK